MQGCVKADDGTPCDTPASQASRAANKKKKKKKPITIGSTTIIPIKVKIFFYEQIYSKRMLELVCFI